MTVYEDKIEMIAIAVLNKFAPEIAEKITLKELKSFIDEWVRK